MREKRRLEFIRILFFSLTSNKHKRVVCAHKTRKGKQVEEVNLKSSQSLPRMEKSMSESECERRSWAQIAGHECRRRWCRRWRRLRKEEKKEHHSYRILRNGKPRKGQESKWTFLSSSWTLYEKYIVNVLKACPELSWAERYDDEASRREEMKNEKLKRQEKASFIKVSNCFQTDSGSNAAQM